MDKETQNPIIIFDGVCHMCDSFVQWVLRWERKPHFKFVAGQSDIGMQLLQKHGFTGDAMRTIVLLEHDEIYTQSTAVLRIIRHLQFPLNVLRVGLIFPAWLRDGIYTWIAKNRYRWFGKKEYCRIPNASQRQRFLE
jgi:predicted DCC family thiol-disulfide oxidoreductase YuxK